MTLRALPIVIGLVLPAAVGAQTVHRVPTDFATIQQAINTAVNGDTVLVSRGTYFEQLNLGDKRIQLRSSDGPLVTTIDATFLGPVVRIGSGADRSTLVEGFTLTHGKGSSGAGGVSISNGSPTVRGNLIVDNRGGGAGNGVSVQFSSALIVDNRIANNHNSGDTSGGGGGGGIYIGGNPCGFGSPPECGAEIRNNRIHGNTALRFTSGGGIDVFAGGPAKIIGNVISDNETKNEGGGISFFNSADALVENNLIVGNKLTSIAGQGGGVFWLVPSGNRGPFLVNNTIVNNDAPMGSGVYADGFDIAARIVNNLIIARAGQTGIECGDFNDANPPVVRNNNVVTSGAAAYADLCSGASGTNGNLSTVPIFVAAGDYRLAAGSAGVDAGNNSFVSQGTDLLGASRIVDGDGVDGATVDIGAYETGDTIFVGRFE